VPLTHGEMNSCWTLAMAHHAFATYCHTINMTIFTYRIKACKIISWIAVANYSVIIIIHLAKANR